MRTRLINLTAGILGISGFVAICTMAEKATWGAAITIIVSAIFLAIHRDRIAGNTSDRA